MSWNNVYYNLKIFTMTKVIDFAWFQFFLGLPDRCDYILLKNGNFLNQKYMEILLILYSVVQMHW